jgi:hypothetical protein
MNYKLYIQDSMLCIYYIQLHKFLKSKYLNLNQDLQYLNYK